MLTLKAAIRFSAKAPGAERYELYASTFLLRGVPWHRRRFQAQVAKGQVLRLRVSLSRDCGDCCGGARVHFARNVWRGAMTRFSVERRRSLSRAMEIARKAPQNGSERQSQYTTIGLLLSNLLMVSPPPPDVHVSALISAHCSRLRQESSSSKLLAMLQFGCPFPAASSCSRTSCRIHCIAAFRSSPTRDVIAIAKEGPSKGNSCMLSP